MLLLFTSTLISFPLWGFSAGEMVFSWFYTPLSLNLILLSILVSFVMVLSSSATLFSPLFLQLVVAMLLILNLTFKVNSFLLFYFSFETALLPIFFLVLGWGYQPERLSASLNLFLYTVAASLPLLLSFVCITSNHSTPTFTHVLKTTLTGGGYSPLQVGLTLALLLSFMVKYPLFFTHLWLPKAHVEAPVAGSMILAAILLKLGGYGLLRALPLLSPNSSLVWGLSVFSVMGGAVISALCLRQTDMKVLIAYSSVAHMSLAIAASLTFSFWGAWAAFSMMLAHGLSSSGMFSAANMSYERFKSRSILMSKSLLTYMPIFSLGWFLLCMSNMGAPPSLNLVSEIFSTLLLLKTEALLSLPLSIVLALAVAFTLVLYASSQQPQPGVVKSKLSSLTPREKMVFLIHILPVFSLSILLTFLL